MKIIDTNPNSYMAKLCHQNQYNQMKLLYIILKLNKRQEMYNEIRVFDLLKKKKIRSVNKIVFLNRIFRFFL